MLKLFLVILSVLVQISVAMREQQKVIGGLTAKEGQFPYLASLINVQTKTNICGAGIIDKRWLLSAAHCFTGVSPLDFIVYVGSVYIDGRGRIYYVEKIIIHPDYIESGNYPNDIALIKVTEGIKLDDYVKTIYLPFGIAAEPGDSVVAAGWGRTSYPNGDRPIQLQYQISAIVSNEDCSAAFQTTILESHICIGGEYGLGMCSGDSGSPLRYVAKNKLYTIGIASWVRPCAVGYPDVYTRVSYYIPWILQKIYT